ncbi:retrovirus-related pol polyprotein from transposon TNT 1-94 [Tanacetum coccineum]
MLASSNYVQWKSRIKRYIDTKPNNELINYCLQNLPHKFKWTEKSVPAAEGIDNDIDSILIAFQMHVKCGKLIERLKARSLLQLEPEWQRSQPTATRNRGKEIINSLLPTYDQEPATIADDDEMSKEKEIDKLMALISLSFKKIYKPTNNNLRTSSNTSRTNQDNSPRLNRGTGYDNQRVVNVAGARENVGTQIQEVTPDATNNSGHIFDPEPLQKVQNDDDNYNVFENDREHPEQPKSVNEPYPVEQDEHNIIIDSLDMCYDREQDDEDDTDDLAKEREIEDFKTKNKSLESSNNHFKEANNELSKTNQLIFKDLKKFQAELDRYHDVNYASKVAIDCAKAKGDLMSYKIESEKSFNEYTPKINDLNQTISDMEKELFAHQETISLMSQEKEAQTKFHKTRDDKELEKIIALENKFKVLDDIFLKKAQRANPRLYDIGCDNDNLALMLAPESGETIRLAQESRSKLSDLIRPVDYDKLNNIYDLFVPQREKSPERQYFSKKSKMSHTSAKYENSKESFNKQTTLLEKRMDESIPWDQKCKSSTELFKIKRSVDTIFDGVEHCKQTIAKRTYFGYIDPFIQNTIEGNFCPQIQRINVDLEKFNLCLKEEMVDDLRYFNSLEHEVDTLKSQLETQKTQLLNEIDRLFGEYYYADHMNAILGVYTTLDEFTDLQCDYVDQVVKCECLEKELSKSKTMSKSFEALQKHAINLELALQQYLKAQLQDKGIAISELKKLIEKIKGKSVETKCEKSSVIRQPNAFKSQRQSVLSKPVIFSDSLAKTDFSKSKSVTKNNVSNDFSKPVTAQILPQHVKSILKNTNVIASGMYKVHTKPNQTRTSQLPQDIRKTNKHVSFSTGVIPTTSVSRPQLKSNRIEDRVMPNNSQGKKQEVEDQRRNFKTRQPIVVPISTREPKRNMNQSVATSYKKTVATESTIKKPRSIIRKLYEQVSKTCSWWYPKFTPSGYKWKPKSPIGNVNANVSMPLGNASRIANILKPMTPRCSTMSNTPLSSNPFSSVFSYEIYNKTNCCDSGCSKHMMGNLKLLSNFVEKFLGTVKFRNDQIALILGYGDLVQGTITIKMGYYVEGLNHNLFSVGQFYYADLEVSFRKCTCYIHDLKGNDLLTGSRGTDLYSITLHKKSTPILICLMAKATSLQAYSFKEDFMLKRNRTLVEAARTMLSAAKVPLFFWAEAIATACFTQNRSLVIPQHEKTPYHIINGQKSSVKFFHIFGSLCYIVRDGENLDKMKEKGDACIFVGYSNQSRAYRVYNKRTRVIVETIHVNFDELPQMASDHTVTMSNELDLLFSLMFDELLNGTPPVVSKSSAVTATDAPNQLPTVTANENIIQAETNKEYAQVDEDEFINVFSTPGQEQGETSSRYVNSSNMHTFYQRHPSEHHWTKDHSVFRKQRNLVAYNFLGGEQVSQLVIQEADRTSILQQGGVSRSKNQEYENKNNGERSMIMNMILLSFSVFSPTEFARVRSYALSWKSCQGGSSKLNLPDHRIRRRCCSLIPVKSDS